MKHLFKLFLPIFVGFSMFLYVATAKTVQAATPGIRVVSASSSYITGQNFTVDVRGTTNGGIYGTVNTNVTITYPANLTYVSSDRVGSVMTGSQEGTTNPIHNTGTRSVSFTTPSSGYYLSVTAPLDGKIFSVTFKAATVGTGNIDFTSTKIRNETISNKTPLAIEVKAPAPAVCPAGQTGTPPNCRVPEQPKCPTGQTGTPPNCQTPATPKPTTPKSQTPAPAPRPSTSDSTPKPETPAPQPVTPAVKLAINDMQTDANYDNIVVSWKVTTKSINTLEYGDTEGAYTNKVDATASKDGLEYTATVPKLAPGQTYYFLATATTDKEKITQIARETTKAYPVKIIIKSEDKSLEGATLTLGKSSETYTTDKDGVAQLALSPGDYTVNVKAKDLSDSQKINIKAMDFEAGGTPDTQVITITVTKQATAAAAHSSPTSSLLPVLLGILGLLATVVVGIVFWIRHKHNSQNIMTGPYIESYDETPSVPTDMTAYQQQAMTPDAYESNITPPQDAYSTPYSYTNTPATQPEYPEAITTPESYTAETTTTNTPPTSTEMYADAPESPTIDNYAPNSYGYEYPAPSDPAIEQNMYSEETPVLPSSPDETYAATTVYTQPNLDIPATSVSLENTSTAYPSSTQITPEIPQQFTEAYPQQNDYTPDDATSLTIHHST